MEKMEVKRRRGGEVEVEVEHGGDETVYDSDEDEHGGDVINDVVVDLESEEEIMEDGDEEYDVAKDIVLEKDFDAGMDDVVEDVEDVVEEVVDDGGKGVWKGKLSKGKKGKGKMVVVEDVVEDVVDDGGKGENDGGKGIWKGKMVVVEDVVEDVVDDEQRGLYKKHICPVCRVQFKAQLPRHLRNQHSWSEARVKLLQKRSKSTSNPLR